MTTKASSSKIKKTVKKIDSFTLSVYDINHKIIDKIALDQKIWGISSHKNIISRVVANENASRRQGTKKTKKRDEVSGGGRKPWRQKGTGRARAGSIRSPLWKGGGIIFGPTGNENYSMKITKNEFRRALLGMLNQFVKAQKLMILKNCELKSPSTKNWKEISAKLNLFPSKQQILFVFAQPHPNLELSARNLKMHKITNIHNLSVYDLLNSEKLVFTPESLDAFTKRMSF